MTTSDYENEFNVCLSLRREGRQLEAKKRLMALERKWLKLNTAPLPLDVINHHKREATE